MSLHGAASWPSHREITEVGLLEPSETALRLGYDTRTDKPLYFDGDLHVFTHALPGAGKTVGAVLPTLVTYGGSAVVTDTKGALTAQTAAYRRDVLGQRIVILNPWAAEMSKALGTTFEDTGFNPLAFLKPDDPSLYDNIELVASIMCPTAHDESETYWPDTARTIIAGCILFLLRSPDHNCTLPDLFNLVRTTRKGWAKLAEKMLAMNDPALSTYAAEILSPLESEKQWAGVAGKINNATSIYASYKPLGKHVSKNNFDPSDFKRENITVYIVIPARRRDANKAWLALVMALCAEAIGTPGEARPVLLLAEEFANLGYVPSIMRAMAEYREAGLRCWLVVQDLHQLRRIYGRDGAQELINLCGIKQFFRVDDLELARQLESTIGTYTAQQTNHSGGWSDKDNNIGTERSQKSRNINASTSHSEIGVPLIRAQDILNLPRDAQIITAAGFIRPMLAKIKPYYFDPELRERIAPNPYRPTVPPLPAPGSQSAPNVIIGACILTIPISFIVFYIASVFASIAGLPHDRAADLGVSAFFLCIAIMPFLLVWQNNYALRVNARRAAEADKPTPAAS